LAEKCELKIIYIRGDDHVNKKIIIIGGYLAAGKTTFAIRLSRAINIPYFAKDTFKTALCTSVSLNNREESSRFSAITFDAMMYATERLMETGCPLIIEGNFVPAGIKKVDEAGFIKTLIDRYDYQSLTYKFMGDTQVLYKRFIERDRSPERAQPLRMFSEPSCDEFNRWCRNLDAFDVGRKIIEIDTTDFKKIDFESYIEAARVFFINN